MRHSREEVLRILGELKTKRAKDIESETLEFKEWMKDTNKLYKTLTEYAVCFANQEGGTVVLGIKNDETGIERAVTGCGGYNVHEIRTRIYEATDPKILVDVEELYLKEVGVNLLLIHMPKGVGIHTTTDGTAKIRIGRDCKPLTGSMRQQKLIEAGMMDITGSTVSGLSWKSLSKPEIERLKNLMWSRDPNSTLLKLQDEDLLEQVGATRHGLPTTAGILLLGGQQLILHRLPNHEVQYLQMKNDIEYERREIYTDGLLKILEEVYRNIEFSNKITTIKMGLFHYEIKDYPEDTYREAVLNAVVHRDYTSPGSVFIKQYRDRLEISNPGGFIGGITVDNVLRQNSVCRNQQLADILRRVGLIEKAGMGIKRIFYTQAASGKIPPSYWTDGSSVRITLQNGTLDEPFVRFIRRRQQEGQTFSLDQLLVLSALRRQRELALGEAAHLLQLDLIRTRETVMQMVRQGLLEKSGTHKGMVFRFSGNLYHELGDSIAYIREKGIDSLRYEEMVMEYVRAYGRITNRQVRELLGLDKYKASRLLRELTEKKKLERMSDKRGASYSAVP